MGDLNYRLKTTFDELAPNVEHHSVRMAKINDQLVDARYEGYYPSYVEQDILFQPTYKMSQTERVYVNKNN